MTITPGDSVVTACDPPYRDHAERSHPTVTPQNAPKEGHNVTRRASTSEGLETLLPALVDAIAERAAAIVLEQLAAASPTSPYMSVSEAADYLRCDRQRIYDLLSAGRLRRFKDGSRVLVARAELDEHVASALPPVSESRTNRRVAA